MNNILIKSDNILINGTIHCSGDVLVHSVVSDNMIFDEVINDDINIKGDLIIDGKLHLIYSKFPSAFDKVNNKHVYNISSVILNSDLRKNYNKNDFLLINSKNVYVCVDNFQVGNIIAYSNINKYYYRKIKLQEIYSKIQTNRLLINTNKK